MFLDSHSNISPDHTCYPHCTPTSTASTDPRVCRWLDGSGILSCRIKIPQSQSESTKRTEESSSGNLPPASAPGDSMNVDLETTSPRRKDKIAEAIQSMAHLNNNMETLALPTDPDAQATVTDFLDFTEYLPSDNIRSLTLIGNLDPTYLKSSAAVHSLTKKYGGDFGASPAGENLDPVALRARLSQDRGEALNARTLAYAEACRMADNVERHYNRAKNILAKLQAMAEAYPPTREPSPEAKRKSPVTARAPKITLRVDGHSGSTDQAGQKVRKRRAPRITVPGEVLAPYELDYESYGSESDWESDNEPLTPGRTPARSIGNNGSRIKLKIIKGPKNRIPKPPRPPGVMGTNVHSSVAGISTSNALAKLQPPPENAVKGSEDAPWLQLTEWELGMLRKRMKKNAVWSPSDTMIARELKQLGRGIEAYRAAKSEAEAKGETFDQPVPPQLLGQTVMSDGAISVEALNNDQDVQLSNRGMKLNEAKKLKKENQAKEAAKLAAEEAEESARKVAEAAKAMKALFGKPGSKDAKKAAAAAAAAAEAKTPSKSPSKQSAKKRKRDADTENSENSPEAEIPSGPPAVAELPERPQQKRSKTETPVPAPNPIAAKDMKQEESAVIEEGAAALKKISTPILPPGRELRKETTKKTEKSTTANTRPRRSSTSAKTPTPAPESKRPGSSRDKADSHEPIPSTAATTDRPRRASTARNTPAPESRQISKRAKRPAPGVVTANHEGSAAVSVGKRSAATRKKASAKKDKKDGREGSAPEIYDEIDDEGNVIDPDEPRYCLCNRVSFGTMIACENNDVSILLSSFRHLANSEATVRNGMVPS